MFRAGSPDTAGSFGGREFIRFANWLKLALGAVALLLVVLIFIWPRVEEEPSDFPVPQLEDPNSADGGATADALNFRGVDKKNQPFHVTAKKALQEERGSDEIQLTAPAAEILLQEGERLAVTAEKGYYNRRSGQLLLVGSVNLRRGETLELNTEEAVIDIREGTAYSDKPVEAEGPDGHVRAEGLHVLENGKKIIFTGHSRLIVNAESE